MPFESPVIKDRQNSEEGKPWRDMTPVELANGYINYYRSLKQKEMAGLESQVQFEENYSPSMGDYRTTEQGGLDLESDTLLSLEADQLGFDSEGSIDYLESKIREVQDDLQMNELARRSIKEGDQDYIKVYAQLETQRREKLEELQKNKVKII